MRDENMEFNLKEISPNIGANNLTGNGGIRTSGDLVEISLFLFVRISRGRDLVGYRDPYVEVNVGRFKGTTLCIKNNSHPEWNQIFALHQTQIQSEDTLEILVKNNVLRHDQCMGRISFAVSDIPTRFPTDGTLAPQWHGLENQRGVRCRGELMLCTWIGTQADEAFHEASHLHLGATSVGIYNVANTCSCIYLMPRIWCLRVYLIQARDLLVEDRTECSQIFIHATLGKLIFTSKSVMNNDGNPKWNEELLIAVAEPFDQMLVLSVRQGTLGSHENIGRCVLPVKNVDMRVDESPPRTRIFGVKRNERFVGRLYLRLSLDGGYHVFDEDPLCSSDMNPTSNALWRPSIGVFEMGILNATGLPAMKPRHRTDAYCVAKYGSKWVRTRTVINSLCPKWNEQYSWDVYDPCTFITICVFDDVQVHVQESGIAAGAIDARIGKVRIRLSELETNRIYSYFYPLVELQPSGLKKMGEIQLAFKFCCPDMMSIYKVYTLPMLPTQHFANPLSLTQLHGLRKQAVMLVWSKMSRTEPPLRREVIEYMLDSHEIMWSMRRCRADFERINTFLSGLVGLYTHFDEIRNWKNPISTLIVLLLLFVVIVHPQHLLPTMFSYLILHVLLQYQTRPRNPSHVDLLLSHVHTTSVDELEEEFDPIPSRFGDNIIRNRYDRLRVAAGKYVALMGHLATRGERLQSLLSWQDPIATILFMILCLISGIVTLIVPFRVIVSVWLIYLLRHPIVRSSFPTPFENWVRRLPSKLDNMI
ncbi:FT-interacting protein 7-like [Abrus precatorius]|uniref:FT-interacting protein 7-like n=1 Tax=Abrus precatorius TaxID=3816 RepID=A0A8B8K0C0_ABRPR|nr:FT-interacting protein 7-like [Abrus precatorius]